ncbi:signal peptide, CUB and EGF-like domain-containing protein 2 isoform X1 [Pyxicephalus adspersus]|uniref:signal peptide, CUB and EGF-like domain-containing protein 2 isoform X1 n=1 Tax=Pyxicephalus adspersus TaxID=30357 RepID=UPI003B5958C1
MGPREPRAEGLSCMNKEHGCAHICRETPKGGVVCDCRPGFELAKNQRDCILTCAHGNGECQHTCNDTDSGPECSCHPKFTLLEDGKSCAEKEELEGNSTSLADVDKRVKRRLVMETCAVNNGGCDRTCRDTSTGVRCSCPIGFTLQLDGKTCKDVDECQSDNNDCEHFCRNTAGSYDCSCRAGYKLMHNEKHCTDIDECSFDRMCDHACINYPGSFACICDKGYTLYGLTHCGDINECSINNGGCAHTCVNTMGDYYCQCPPRYKLHWNRKDCVEADIPIAEITSSKASLQCVKNGGTERCFINCPALVHSVPGLQESYTLTCGKPRHPKGNETANGDLLTIHTTISLKSNDGACRMKRTDAYQGLAHNKVSEKQNLAFDRFDFVNITCKRRASGRKTAAKETVITVQFELEANQKEVTESCNYSCVRRKAEKRLRKTIRAMRKAIGKDQFHVRLSGKDFEVTKKIPKGSETPEVCGSGQARVDNRCVSCHAGTYHDGHKDQCVLCPNGTFQNDEGQIVCEICPAPENIEIPKHVGARDLLECGAMCPPGEFSLDGFRPCDPCPLGTYQPDSGRTSCFSCGGGLTTRNSGASSFHDCETKGESQHKNTIFLLLCVNA